MRHTWLHAPVRGIILYITLPSFHHESLPWIPKPQPTALCRDLQ